MGPTTLNCPDYGRIIHTGISPFIEEARQKLLELRYYDAESVTKANFYKASLIALPTIIRLAGRYADLTETMANDENDEKRKKELIQIAEICRHIPGRPYGSVPLAPVQV